MTEELPEELRDFSFDELTNNQQNIWKLRDELNATRRWLRENTVNSEEDLEVNEVVCTHTNSYQMRVGLMRCKDCKKIYKV